MQIEIKRRIFFLWEYLNQVTWPQGYKTFFMLSTAEYEIIFHAYKTQITNNAKFFLAKHSWAWKFLC